MKKFETIKNTTDLVNLHEVLTTEARTLMVRKNADYKAGSGDVFANFRMAKLAHVEEVQGVIVRMMDKLARWLAFLEKGELEVKEESVFDVSLDLINYTVIATGLLIEKINAPKNFIPGKDAEDVIKRTQEVLSKALGSEVDSRDVRSLDECIQALTALKDWTEVVGNHVAPQVEEDADIVPTIKSMGDCINGDN